MDVSIGRQQSESNRAVPARETLADQNASGGVTPPPGPMPASPRRMSPIRYGVLMGIAAAASVALTACCMASVAGRLGPGRRYLNGAIVAVSVLTGIYVGIQAWRNQKAPRPASCGRCPDCGREYTAGEKLCSLCGRPAQQMNNQD